MTERKKKLRSDIISKFETVVYFCKLAKYDHRNFYTFLNSKSDNEKMYQDAVHKMDTIKVDHIKGNIRDKDREAIRICIATWNNYKPGSLTKFSDKHKKFDMVYLSNVIGGRLKYETAKYKSLIKILKKDYNLILKTELHEQSNET